jgi:hypothetical protein
MGVSISTPGHSSPYSTLLSFHTVVLHISYTDTACITPTLTSFDKANVNAQPVAAKLIANFFSKPLATDVHVLASKPAFSASVDRVVINVFYYLADRKALNNSSIE